MKESLTLLLIGRSGSGKGTQAKLLKERFNFDFLVSTGSKFREEVSKNTFVAKEIKKILENGDLAPAWMSSFMWERFLIEDIITNNEKVIFDGIGRRVEEAHHLDEVMKFFNRKIVPVHIEVDREEAVKRLKSRGRSDDNDDDIKRRMDWFESEVSKTLDYYKKQERLIEINGMLSIEGVYQDMVKKLELNK
ncbi:MAG: nucleoside monophosphate kinase [Candidatus Paceibacterota bacterium]